ncbi:MAG: hypothetical protein LBF80_06505 [Spirochaetaceae bacterium]|jgi:hypothetical protein|nr:hypothetical protein [Spirochaetaceae bacterium]
MRLKENIVPRGKIEARVFRNGGLIDSFVEENLILNGARRQLARLIAGNVEDRHITRIAFGTNGNPASDEDEELENEYQKDISGLSFPSPGSVRFDWLLDTSEYNGEAVIEFGLRCADGTLFSRRVRDKPIPKEYDISIEGSWTISFEPVPEIIPEEE